MIVLMGVAGAGKSVQGRLLSDVLGYRWLSTGEFLRMHISGERRKAMLAGELLNDQEIIEVLEGFLSGTDDDCIILDGFPRTIVQAKWLLDHIDKSDKSLEAVINIKVSEPEVKKRLLARGRPDDTGQVIDKRFREYEAVTLPILNLYKQQGVLVVDINGEQPVDSVHEEIVKSLNSLKK